MRILVVAPEIAPFAKTSEVADVVASLSSALAEQGHDVRLVMPRYPHMAKTTFGLELLLDDLTIPMDGRHDRGSIFATTTQDGLPVYLIDSTRYFGEHTASLYVPDADPFVFFSRAVLEMLQHPQLDWHPDVIHCHDWQTALVPNLLRTIYDKEPALSDVASVLTIHRLSHQGIFGYRVLESAGIKEYGFIHYAGMADLDELVDLLGRGIYYSDAVTTVSEHYAQEIQTAAFGEQLDPLLRDRKEALFGIRSGIDVESYDPAHDASTTARFDRDHLPARAANKQALQRMTGLTVNGDAPLLAMVTRLTEIKGIDMVLEIAPLLVKHLGAQLLITGSGEQPFHDRLARLHRAYPGAVAVQFGFDERLQRQVYASADMILMPSRIEPCGLGQMIALRYGAVPVVRYTGGLADTVQDYDPRSASGNGFVFGPNDAMALYTAIVRAVEVYRHSDLWAQLQQRAMGDDYSWTAPAKQYECAFKYAIDQCAARQNLV